MQSRREMHRSLRADPPFEVLVQQMATQLLGAPRSSAGMDSILWPAVPKVAVLPALHQRLRLLLRNSALLTGGGRMAIILRWHWETGKVQLLVEAEVGCRQKPSMPGHPSAVVGR